MANILFLAHRIPYPPDKGDKIRSWHILRYLAKDHRVYLGCFVDDPDDLKYETVLENHCVEVQCQSLHRRMATIKSLSAFLSSTSLSIRFYKNHAMKTWVNDLLARERIDYIYVYSSTMAQFAFVESRRDIPIIMDFVDVDSQKWTQYAKSKPWPLSWLYAYEGQALLREERSIAGLADENLFVSEAEAELFKSLAPEAQHVNAMPNGVDFNDFSPDEWDAASLEPGQYLVFTGAMDYWANREAVRWFVQECWGELKTRWPDLNLYIVGSNPHADVLKLADTPGVFVTGRVDKVQPYLKAADVVIAPLRIARGIQNKVLEAMAMARPIVASPEAAEGIDVQDAQELLIADGPQAFITAIQACLEDTEKAGAMAQKGRAKAISSYSWDAQLARLGGLLATDKADAAMVHSELRGEDS